MYDPRKELQYAGRWVRSRRQVRRVQIPALVAMIGGGICFVIPGRSFLGMPQIGWAALILVLVLVAVAVTAYLWRCPICRVSLGLEMDPYDCPRCGFPLRWMEEPPEVSDRVPEDS